MPRTYEVRNPSFSDMNIEDQIAAGISDWCAEDDDGREFFGRSLDEALEAQALNASHKARGYTPNLDTDADRDEARFTAEPPPGPRRNADGTLAVHKRDLAAEWEALPPAERQALTRAFAAGFNEAL